MRMMSKDERKHTAVTIETLQREVADLTGQRDRFVERFNAARLAADKAEAEAARLRERLDSIDAAADTARCENERSTIMEEVPVTTSRVECGLSKRWMEEHPGLAVKAILKFFDEHRAPAWSLSMQRDYMPGMHIMLVATRRSQ